MMRLSIFLIIAGLSISPFIGNNKRSLSLTDSNKINTSILKTDSNQIKIIPNYKQINSISELLKLFKNKPVFLDLWATWCNPCLEEFKYSKPLYEYLTKNGIEIIYV